MRKQNLGAKANSLRLRKFNRYGVPAEPAPWGAAAKMLEFEYAAILRDRLMELRKELK